MVSLELSSKMRNLELGNEKLTRMYQEMMVCVTEGNRAKMELTDHNHKQQMELNIITTWWQDAEKENTKLLKNASRLRSQKVETLDLLDKERNQNLILNNHIQQLQEERKKEKKEDEEVIKDLQRQLTTLQQAMTSPQNHTSKQHECTGNEQHHVCIVMEEEEEDHAENLQKEEEHGQEERSSHQKEEKGQNLQKDPSQDLSSQEQEDSEQKKNHQVIQEMTQGHSAAAADKLCLKMSEKINQKMTSEESTIVERTERTGLMTSNDDVSKSRMIAEERTVSERTERTDLMSSKEDVSKSKMEQKEERVMTQMRSWRDDLMAKALNEAKDPWREVSGHAKDQNKAEAPSMIRALKQPEHNRQLCIERTDGKNTSSQNHTSKQHECTGNEQHHVCIMMLDEEEEEHVENLQMEEHGEEEMSSHQKEEEKGQNLRKELSQDLRSQEQEDYEQKNHQVIQEMTSGHSATAADKACLKMLEKIDLNRSIGEKPPVYANWREALAHYTGETAVKARAKQNKSLSMIPVQKELKQLNNQIRTEKIRLMNTKGDINKIKMTSEESTIVERTARTGLMTSNDGVSKSRMIAEEHTVSERTERTDLMSSKEDVSKSKVIAEERTLSEHTEKTDLMSSKDDVRKSKMDQKEERVMTPMRSWRDDLMAKALNEAKAPWREVSGHAKVQNKAETMAKAQHEAKAPSMIRALKQPEHNRQLCTERTDLKEHKGDMSKNNTIAEEKTLLERLKQKKLMNYWKSRAVVIDMIDET